MKTNSQEMAPSHALIRYQQKQQKLKNNAVVITVSAPTCCQVLDSSYAPIRVFHHLLSNVQSTCRQLSHPLLDKKKNTEKLNHKSNRITLAF